MPSPKLLILPLSLWIAGCDGGVCPAIFIPTYEINVYDLNSDELLCTERLGLSSANNNCDINVEYVEGDNTLANITVTLEGYKTQTISNAPNQTGRHQCFDQPTYTKQVDVLLEPNE